MKSENKLCLFSLLFINERISQEETKTVKKYKKIAIIITALIVCVSAMAKVNSHEKHEVIEAIRKNENKEETNEYMNIGSNKKNDKEEEEDKSIVKKNSDKDEKTQEKDMKAEATIENKEIKIEEKIESKENEGERNEDNDDDKLSLLEKLDKVLNNKQGTYYVGIKDLKNNDDLYIGDENTSVPSASVIKIYIMIEYFNQVNQGIIENSQENLILVQEMIHNSNNESTNTLIDLLSMENINKTILELGYTGTRLDRKMLDFQSRLEGKDNYTSVSDTMIILEEIYAGSCISKDMDKMMMNIMKGQNKKNKIPSKLPKDIDIYNKTGELPVDSANGFLGVENDVAIINGKNSRYIICIFTNNLNSCSDGVNTIQGISKVVFEHLESGKEIYSID